MEEYITVKAYMKRFKTGYKTVMNMINAGQLEYTQTPSGKYRIKVGGDTVSRKQYEKVCVRVTELETTIKILKNTLKEVNV